MAKRGRKAKHPALRLATGEHANRPPTIIPATPREGVPKCPSWLDRMGRDKWKWLVVELSAMGVLTLADSAAMAAYCDTWSRWRKATNTLRREGTTYEVESVTGSTYLKARPEVTEAAALLAAIRGYQTEFGLTPASRKRVSADPKKTKVEPEGISGRLGFSAQVG